MASYIVKEFARDRQPDILEAVSRFEALFSGQRRQKIMPSPAKTEMRAYCGKAGITPAQWVEKRERIHTEYNLTQYKIDHFRDI